MRALIQRVSSAAVYVENSAIASIDRGVVILIGVTSRDTAAEATQLAEKIARLRIFSDDQGKFKHSLLDVNGKALVVSQFTLYADTRRGRRPSFTEAAAPAQAAPLIDFFCQALIERGISVQIGIFGANMLVEIHNDGPVTIWLDTAER